VKAPACILVVDDNPTNLKLVSDVLEFEGYEILKAADAEVAQEIIGTRVPDLILMDIALPGMDGLTLTRQLKADPRTRRVIIVALTAFAMKGDRDKALLAGCDGYITKPFDTRALAPTVAGLLDRVGSEPETFMKILVVEDHAMELKLVHHVLSSAGHSVMGAEAAEQAFDAIKNDRPEIILLDMTLPGMDGLSLVRKLRADASTRDIHVVAVTGNPERFQRQEALDAGCDAYLVKPLSTRTLPQTLTDLVGAGRSGP
jgi:two-component system cell cycle response regulator